MLQPKVSVVIVTKNRAAELSHCFGSLLSNSVLPDQIVVVDNNSCDNTKQLVYGLALNTKIPIKYVFFDGIGYPTVYNKGLQEAQYDWVACIDDDCVASYRWMEEIKKTISINPKVSAVMGWCETYYPNNLYSQATILFDNVWKQRAVDNTTILDLEVLDNKNVVYNKKFLLRSKLQYDENRVRFQHGAAEDCDLGIQIQEAGGNAILNKNILIWHKDPQDWLWFMKKNIASWRAYNSLRLKWNMQLREKLKKPTKSITHIVADFSQERHLTWLAQLRLLFIAKQLLLLNRLLSLMYRNKYE